MSDYPSAEASASAAEARDNWIAASNLLAAARLTLATVEGARPPAPSSVIAEEAWRIEYRLASSRVRELSRLLEAADRAARFLGAL